jgi:hypothetical protein
MNYVEGDMVAAAAKILAGMPKQTLRLTPDAERPRQQFTVDSTNIDRVDLFLNVRPIMSQNVTDPSFALGLPSPATVGDTLAAYGYRKGELVVSTRLRL